MPRGRSTCRRERDVRKRAVLRAGRGLAGRKLENAFPASVRDGAQGWLPSPWGRAGREWGF